MILNKTLYRAWNGNIDLQICLDFFSVITYITDYYAKDESGTMKVIKQALAQNESKDVKDQMKLISNTFLTSRQMGEAEAVFRLIPSMTLKGSNVTCQWVSTEPVDERSKRFRKASEAQMKSGISVFKIEGHEGYFFEVQDIYSKYLRRPKELKECSFAQFSKMYRSKAKNVEEEIDKENDNEELHETNDEDENIDHHEIFEKFNFVMSYDNSKTKICLPPQISLSNVFPGEAAVMKKRQFPAALRFHKKYSSTDSLRYMFSEVILYYPHNEEIKLEDSASLYEETFCGERKVDIIKKQVMENLEDVTEARYYVEEVFKEIDMEKSEIAMDPAFAQENLDCMENGIAEHSDYIHLDPEMLDLENENLSSKSIYRRVEIPSLDSLKVKTRALDKFQRHVVDIGIQFSKDVVKARNSFSKPPNSPLLMVHGGAGAGKSTVINILAQWVQFILQKEGDSTDSPCVLKVAPTGAAASLIEGQTLHAAFRFSFGGKSYSLSDKARDQTREILKNLKMVSIFYSFFFCITFFLFQSFF